MTYDNARNHTGGIAQFQSAGAVPVTDIGWTRTYNPDGRLTGGTDAAGTPFTASVTPAGDLAAYDLANGADRWAYTYDRASGVAPNAPLSPPRRRSPMTPTTGSPGGPVRRSGTTPTATGPATGGWGGATTSYRAGNSPAVSAGSAYDEAGRTRRARQAR